jgi:hypothetical protein
VGSIPARTSSPFQRLDAHRQLPQGARYFLKTGASTTFGEQREGVLMRADSQGAYLGFDPGGDGKFGVAILDGVCVTAASVGTVDAAMNWAVDSCGSRRPIAAGIDTLLHWATDQNGGLRPCDLGLRKKYQPIERSVMAPNSLYGAMAIGGMALAFRLRAKWPELELNETHPKVLLHALGGPRYEQKRQETVDAAIQWFVSRAHCIQGKLQGEHELDAALSAWATREGVVEGWPDIVGNSVDLLFPVGTVRYLWPEAIDQPTEAKRMSDSACPEGMTIGSIDECEIKVEGQWQRIEIAAALAMDAGALMRCPECHGRVRVHKAGTTGQRAHFEHYTAHGGCSKSRTFSGHRSDHSDALQ